jgi:hypothetical protein
MPCDIYVGPFGRNGATAVVVNPTSGAAGSTMNGSMRSATVYERDATGRWSSSGTLNHIDCPAVAEALRLGHAGAVAPEHTDLMVNGIRLEFISNRTFAPQCQEEKPPDTPALQKTPADAQAPAHMGPAFGSPR